MGRFIWKIAENGYVWKGDSLDQDSLYLAATPDSSFREYAPLHEFTGLFRAFAATDVSQDGVRSFATRYGQLGFGSLIGEGRFDDSWETMTDEQWDLIERKLETDEPSWESLGAWIDQVELMRTTVASWDAIRMGAASTDKLQQVQKTVSRQLRGRTNIVFEHTSRVQDSILKQMPTNLLGALWLQFAEAIAGSTNHRPCHACGEYFEVSPSKFRKSKHYYSDRCRGRAYRLRKTTNQDARTLCAEGLAGNAT